MILLPHTFQTLKLGFDFTKIKFNVHIHLVLCLIKFFKKLL